MLLCGSATRDRTNTSTKNKATARNKEMKGILFVFRLLLLVSSPQRALSEDVGLGDFTLSRSSVSSFCPDSTTGTNNCDVDCATFRSNGICYPSTYGQDCAEGKTTCDLTVCAEDGTCHPLTCENIYRYGSELWRGRRSSVSSSGGEEGIETQDELECYVNEFPPNGEVEVELACPQDGDGRRDLFPIAVVFHALDVSPFSSMNAPKEVQLQCSEQYDTEPYLPVNRVCTAKPNPEQRFICYDIAPDTDLTSYFDDYLEAVESLARCNDGSFINDDKNFNNNNMTNCTLKGHHIPRAMAAGDMNILWAYQSDGDFDPFVVAALSINTLLIDDLQPSETPSATPSTSSSPNLSGLRSSNIFAMILGLTLILVVVVVDW